MTHNTPQDAPIVNELKILIPKELVENAFKIKSNI